MSFLIDAAGSQQMILIFGVALVAIYVMARFMRKNAQGGPDKSLTTEEQIERLRQLRGMHGDLEKLMIEIEELAQRWGKRLDQKAMQMDRLLEEADAKIAELKRLRGEASETRPRDAFVRDDEDGKAEREPRGARVIRPAADSPDQPRLRMAREDDFTPPRGQPMPAAPPRETTLDPLAASVYKLADAGHAPMEIARRLNEEIGKVELILALRRA